MIDITPSPADVPAGRRTRDPRGDAVVPTINRLLTRFDHAFATRPRSILSATIEAPTQLSQLWMAGHRPSLPAWMLGAISLAVLLTLWAGIPGLRGFLRERALDQLLPLAIPTTSTASRLRIVDIDRAALDRFGPWPWPRAQLAKLVTAVAAAHPAALGLDILLAGPDRFAEVTAGHNPSPGDVSLRDALRAVPAVLGFALAVPGLETPLPATPVLVGGTPWLPGLWRAPGVVGPDLTLAGAAQGFGALVTAADPDGPIRRVPLLVLTGSTLRPGLALELVRLATGASALVLDPAGNIRAGGVVAPAGEDAALRLSQPSPSSWGDRTISAATLLANPAAAAPLAGRLVLIGASAPEAGGLRVTPASVATPSVQIQAAAVEALLQGSTVARRWWLGPGEVIGSAALGALALLLAARLKPATGALLTVILAIIWAGAALTAAREAGVLADPAGPAAVMLSAFAAAALARFAQEEWHARLLRASFEQHLAPEVVRRIAAEPGRLRLQGELREITSMFTDIEGFTAMTERADPADLIALLDTYFDVVTNVITGHGGMVDKIVGDAVHAIFNAPFEVPEHPTRAVDCALALLAASDTVRRLPLGQRLRGGSYACRDRDRSRDRRRRGWGAQTGLYGSW